MNKIRLQSLTPDIYYSHSRDFQFIGRLFDVVLNSVKTNTESIYNLPISDNSDERLIDLMTLTLGFKSRHNYNIKQLTALCSAFATVIKNKGNINSITLAIRALLNAEGVDGDLDVSVEDDFKTINLFIPQKLTDINLLKDLLIYILPAGMRCNIIREFRQTTKAASNVTSVDTITIYEGTYDTSTETSYSQTNIGAFSPAKSTIVAANEYGITDALAKSYPGLLANTDVYRPAMEGSASVASLYYNITYVTNGGKITNNITTPYSYKVGIPTTLPTVVLKANTIVVKEDKKEHIRTYTFDGWYLNPEYTGEKITGITNTDTNNKVFYAKYIETDTPKETK